MTYTIQTIAEIAHRQLSPDELFKTGVPQDAVRLSIGIEHIEDLLTDLRQAESQLAVSDQAIEPLHLLKLGKIAVISRPKPMPYFAS